MGQKTNPIGNRLGIIRGWDSSWYGGRDYGDKLAEDDKIRKYINARLSRASVSSIIIERSVKLIVITIKTARPGIIIGKGGSEVDKLKEELKKITSKEVQLNIFEIKRPELDAFLVGSSIARQIENRISYRRAIKMSIAAAMRRDSLTDAALESAAKASISPAAATFSAATTTRISPAFSESSAAAAAIATPIAEAFLTAAAVTALPIDSRSVLAPATRALPIAPGSA